MPLEEYMDLDRKIRNYIYSLGLDTFGAIECRKFEEIKEQLEMNKRLKLKNPFEEEDIEKRINPFLLYEDGKSIISIAFPYLYPTKGEENPYFSKYTMGSDYHLVVKSYLNKILEYIKSFGGDGIALVDSNPLPERYLAKLCGVGFIGKNNMIITEKYGSYVFLGEIITNIVNNINELQAALDAATTGTTTIYLGKDIEGDVVDFQKADRNIVIEGGNNKYNGTIKIHTGSNYNNGTITIKNVAFETSKA